MGLKYTLTWLAINIGGFFIFIGYNNLILGESIAHSLVWCEAAFCAFLYATTILVTIRKSEHLSLFIGNIILCIGYTIWAIIDAFDGNVEMLITWNWPFGITALYCLLILFIAGYQVKKEYDFILAKSITAAQVDLAVLMFFAYGDQCTSKEVFGDDTTIIKETTAITSKETKAE